MFNYRHDPERQSAEILKIAAQLVPISDKHKLLNGFVKGLITPTFGFKVAYFRLVEPDGGLDIYACAGTQGQYVHDPHYKLPPGVGISGEVIKTKQPIAISDVRHDERFYFKFKELRDREGIVGMLTVPLLSGENAIGVLCCYTIDPYDFSEAEISTIEHYASLAVAALSNAQHRDDLYLLNQVSEELASEVELDQVLKVIVRQVRRIANADGVVLYPYDPDKERFDLDRVEANGIGKNRLLEIKNRPRPGGVSMTVLQEGKLEVVDLQEAVDHKLIKSSTRDVLVKEGIHAFIGWRLKGHQSVGTLYLNFSDPQRLPSRDKLRMLVKLTYQAALAIERARKFERCRRESSLFDITAKVTASVQLVRKNWDVFLDAAMELTRANAGNISIVRPDGRYLDQLVPRGFPDDYRDIPLEVGGRSIEGQVASLKEPILIYDVEDDPQWSFYYHRGIPCTRSELAVPICTDDSDERQVIAIINLESTEEANFSVQDMELVKLLCIHMRIAIQSAGDYEQLGRRREQLLALVKVAKNLTASLNQDNYLQIILEQTAELFKAHVATIQRLKDGNRLVFEEVYPEDRYEQLIHDIPNGEMPLNGEGITVEAALTRLPVLVVSTRTHPGFKDGSGGRTNSELAVPLLLDDQEVLGVLNVEHEDYGAFSRLDVEIMQWLAQIVVSVLQQAERYEEAAFPAEARTTLEGSANNEQQAADQQKVQSPNSQIKLTPRELAVLSLVDKRLTTPEIAKELVVSPNTVKVQVKSFLRKLNVHNRVEAVRVAYSLGILPING